MYRIAAGKPSNADRIRAMTDEELAEFLCVGDCYYCLAGDETREKCKWDKERNISTGMIDWLKEEVELNEN
jgi:hypothetical protein